MSKPNGKVRNLEAILRKREEVVGGRDVEFSWNGKHYAFPHPAFADDEWQERLTEAKTPADSGVAILGEEQYAKFRADGGQATFLMHLMQEVSEEIRDVTPEGTPTASSTS